MVRGWGVGEPYSEEDRFSGKEMENVDEIVGERRERGMRGGVDLFDGDGGNEGFDVQDETILGWS